MKTHKLAAAAVVITCLGAALPAMNWAQEKETQVAEKMVREQEMAARQAADAQKSAAKQASRAIAQVKRVEGARFRQDPFSGWAGPPGPFFASGSKGIQRHLTQIQEAAEFYCDAKDGADKEQALKRLRDLSSKYFEEDMDVRKKELVEIEARLAKLRSQLDRRRAKKDEIVDLQVKVAINEAEGLGFTSAPRENFKFDVRVAAPVLASADARAFYTVADPQSGDTFGPPVRVETQVPPLPPLPPVEDSQPFGPGAKGDAVRLLQETLNEKLVPSPELTVDGDFGPETDRAVKAFQAENDLEETGVVDEATSKKLKLPAELPPFTYN
jgi:murein L,D-transpeptidase YcbB/YkuD